MVESLHSSRLVDDKRLRIDMAVLKDMMDQNEITSVSWIPTVHQLANGLTSCWPTGTGIITGCVGFYSC